MVVVAPDPNSVHIRMVSVGCCKSRFDSTYPPRLNGIISQNEFQESIDNINSRYPSKKIPIITAIIVALCLISGITLLVVGITSAKSRLSGYTILWAIGVAFIGLALILLMVGCIVNGIRRTKRMQKAIAEESKKYSTRSSTACSWRLFTYTIRSGYGRNATSRLVYQIIIHIGQPAGSENINARFHSNRFAPAAYPGQSATFCSECGVPRQDLTVKFCPSCGQSFNKY